ncbi:ribosomal protein S18 acetylase RimI-like enzyme [Stackebrandtia albiflava]|uniref:Ribosomal protein S18 acetylase RimI-like enzyme n=2 Tax=Stackebrandtia albiflava TaxID=406432 RepID=A0A562V0U6_9ACTN|nr:ribosomal protein S18 acetylase RimI-like enzyme [Stackebrandtia albiflava]
MTTDPDSVTVRPATVDDDAALLAIEKTAWNSDSGFPSMRDPDQVVFFDAERRPVDIHFVAEHAGRIIGYIRLAPAANNPESAHVLLIPGLAVDPAARGRGAALRLLEHVAEVAAARGARKIMLYVFATNDAAIRLYRRAGYVEEGRMRDQLFIDGRYIDSLLMAKHLV